MTQLYEEQLQKQLASAKTAVVNEREEEVLDQQRAVDEEKRDNEQTRMRLKNLEKTLALERKKKHAIQSSGGKKMPQRDEFD